MTINRKTIKKAGRLARAGAMKAAGSLGRAPSRSHRREDAAIAAGKAARLPPWPRWARYR
jgi:hypothetical protein